MNLFAARSASIFIHCRARGGEWCSFLVVGGSVKPWGWSGGLPKWRKILPRNKRLQKKRARAKRGPFGARGRNFRNAGSKRSAARAGAMVGPSSRCRGRNTTAAWAATTDVPTGTRRDNAREGDCMRSLPSPQPPSAAQTFSCATATCVAHVPRASPRSGLPINPNPPQRGELACLHSPLSTAGGPARGPPSSETVAICTPVTLYPSRPIGRRPRSPNLSVTFKCE